MIKKIFILFLMSLLSFPSLGYAGSFKQKDYIVAKSELLKMKSGSRYVEQIDTIIVKLSDKKRGQLINIVLNARNQKGKLSSKNEAILAYLQYSIEKHDSILSTPSVTTPEDTSSNQQEAQIGVKLNITVIDDKRCNDCQTEDLIKQLKKGEGISDAIITKMDFSDLGTAEMLTKEGIDTLPAFIFSHNDVYSGLAQYLTILPSKKYILNIGSRFDPFESRSERGLQKLSGDELKNLKSTLYTRGNKDATISMITYGGLQDPFSERLFNNKTIEELEQSYEDDMNFSFGHFPLSFQSNSKPGAEIAECLADQKGSDAFYALIEKSFKDGNSSKTFLIDEAVNFGANKSTLETCINADTYSAKIEAQMAQGKSLFGITGTPGNVLINNETGEYEVLAGAYPTESFEAIIDKLK